MNKSKRDELAHEYMNSIFRLEPYQEPPDFDECFKHGYSAGYAEAQEQAKVLVEALETYECENFCDIAGVVCTDKICMALEQYKKSQDQEP